MSVTTKLVTRGCRCGDTVQVNIGRCSADAAWTKLGRRKCEGHYSILRRARKSSITHGLGIVIEKMIVLGV